MKTKTDAEWYLKSGLIETAFMIYDHISVGEYCQSISKYAIVDFIQQFEL